MISPMSPLPRMTHFFAGILPMRLTKFCAVPAVNTPAGRVPCMSTCFAVLSRQPVASTSAFAVKSSMPSRLTHVTAKPSAFFSIFVTKVSVYASIGSSFTKSMYLSAYSGPASFSPKRISPNPSCTHCLSMPPSLASRSSTAVLAPALHALSAAASPAGPPPITITS